MKLLTVVLTATCLALAGTSAYLWRELGAERQRAARAEQKLETDRTAQSQIAAAAETSMPVAATPGPSAATPNIEATQAESPEVARMRREQMNPYASPQGRETMRLLNKVVSKRIYADLIKDLGLRGQQADTLLNALADQQEREADLFLQMRPEGRVSRETVEAVKRDLQTQTQAQVACVSRRPPGTRRGS